jgi:hypothetical protein
MIRAVLQLELLHRLFVRAVASDLETKLSGQANEIYDQISKEPWVRIAVGKQASTIAGVSAAKASL